MPALDPDNLLQEISPDSPSGADLSYDTDYLELFRLAEGTPEQQMGDTLIAAEEPNWRDVRDRSTDLLKKSRDLRLIVLATAASLRTEGLQGLEQGMRLLRGAIDQHWDTLYPRLDPDDGNDPLERVNIIAGIAAPPETFGDTLRFRRKVREAPLTDSRQLGRFSLRDIARAAGEGGVGGAASADGNGDSTPAISMSIIDAAFEDTPVETLQQLSEAATTASGHIRAIESALDSRIGAGQAPNLDGLRQDLAEICSCLGRYLAKRGYGSADPGGNGAPGGDSAGAPGSGGGGGRGQSDEIASTQDVLLAIDRICQYYERHEPSSPVPLLLKRAKRLVSKSFLDIINDLSPDALGQVKALGGIEDPE